MRSEDDPAGMFGIIDRIYRYKSVITKITRKRLSICWFIHIYVQLYYTVVVELNSQMTPSTVEMYRVPYH